MKGWHEVTGCISKDSSKGGEILIPDTTCRGVGRIIVSRVFVPRPLRYINTLHSQRRPNRTARRANRRRSGRSYRRWSHSSKRNSKQTRSRRGTPKAKTLGVSFYTNNIVPMYRLQRHPMGCLHWYWLNPCHPLGRRLNMC